ncbi:MAG TPA: class I SAM-dependent methyltransferase [Firmicutes bacterium]|nr:class I SAM-dependent methyltransferase [Bacillota bacterium]
MESHPELRSDGIRLEIRKRIHATYSKEGHNLYELALAIMDSAPSESILDVGCGLGDFLIGLRAQGHMGKLVGIERSVELVEQARSNAEKTGMGVEIRFCDAERLEFKTGTFDCVTALHVLGHADPEKVLPEIGRVLKSDGKFIASTNSKTSYPLLEELKRRAMDRFGWFLASEWTEGFDSESAPDMLRRYFGTVNEYRYDDVLQYPDAEVLVDFFRSTRGLWAEGLTEAEWERIIDWARDQALELIPEHGYAEDPKCFSLFLCKAPLGL